MTKTFKSRVLRIFCAFILTSGVVLAFAHKINAQGIGLVNVQKVLRDSDAAKSIQPEIEKLQKDFQKEIREQERRLRQAEQQLSRARSILAPDAFAQKRRAFSEDARRVQLLVQKRRRSLNLAIKGTKKEILNHLVKVAQEVAETLKLSVLIEKRFVFISEKSLDVTDEIIRRLNKRLPTVKIVFEKTKKGK
ncbi:MAG: OmpH family outer membrane protein [Pseudomonadota bacterium]|nr:OmpH family outer membrane protein [Pseudomonadota bacterium]